MPRLYFVYYYETKDGDSGMSNVVLSNMTTIKTMQDLVNVIAYIKGQESDPEKFTKIEPINWMPLEG